MPIPPKTIQPKFSAASCKINCPVPMVINANRKTIKLEASFNKLSPSSIEASLFGTFTNFNMAPTLTASGGDTMPPKRNPNASVNPGIKWLDTKATAKAVRNTIKKAKLPIILRQRQSSFQEVDQAAS
ncbi:hypothetical protein D3C86_1490540 [compost metagenome]